eukprot:scaffold11198_cov103-Skeletonema_dohrnii-CCMP3373.AAC.6
MRFRGGKSVVAGGGSMARAWLLPAILSLLFVAGMIVSTVDVDHFSNATDQHKQQQEVIAETNLQQHLDDQPIEEETPTTCLDPSGPQPYILMSLGRSGSGSTWQVIGNLSGMETPSHEYTGGSTKASIKFFEGKGHDDKWLLQYLCRKQRKYRDAGVVGFKWKPYEPIFNAPAAQAAINTISTLKDPTIKVVRLRRNLLDVQISRRKHTLYTTKAHCMKGDSKCLQEGLITSLDLYTGEMDTLYNHLESLHAHEDRVDKLLHEKNVPHVQVTYDRLYNVDGKGGDIEEWEKVFSFLGVGPASNLTREQLERGMKHAATHPPGHNMTLANYDEVAGALEGTKFENLLHRRHRRV